MPTRQFRPRRQTKEWNSFGSTELNMTANGTFAAGTTLTDIGPRTVLRMLGEYILGFTEGGTFAAGDQVQIGLGIGIFSQDAVTVGPTALPEPLNDAEFPWLFWASHQLFLHDTTIQSISAGRAQVRHRFDIRSMRKLPLGQALGYVVEYVDGSGTPPVTANLAEVRTLVGH